MKGSVYASALTVLFMSVSLLVSCETKKGTIDIKSYSYADTTEYASVSVSVELPASYRGVEAEITNILHQALDERLSRVTSFEGQRFFQPYDGDLSDNDAFVKYYFDEVVRLISGLAAQDAEERASYMKEDEQMTDAEIKDVLASFPGWEYEFTLSKIEDTPRYVVFESQDYIYMGGAHGGVGGDGCLTFSKEDGHLVKAIVEPENQEQMQSLLRNGLASYFSECGADLDKDALGDYLLIDSDNIPLPSWQPYPTKDGLVFTYQQYEVAPYAAGMPSFVIQYDDVLPYLTGDARKVLGMK